jgi:MFS family permease
VRLFRNPAFVALWGARAVSVVGDQVAAVALVLLVSRTHPAKAVGGLLLAEALPWLLSPFAGAIADRRERRSLMIFCQLAQAALFTVIVVWLPPYAALLPLIAAASTFGTVVAAAGPSSLPRLVATEEILPANALLGAALNTSVILGPALGGALASASGPRLALAVDAASFLGSAFLLLRLPRLTPEPSSEPSRGAFAGALEGLRYALRDRVLRALFSSTALLVAFAGVDNVALVYLVRHTLGGGSLAFGAATATFGIGMLTATVLLMRFTRWRVERVVVGGTLATAIGTALTGLAPTLATVYPPLILAGVGNGIEVAAGNTLIQRYAPPQLRGRLTGASQASVGVGFLVAYLGGGAVVDATSPRTAFVIAGIGATLATLVLRPVLRSVKDPHA